MMHVEVPSKSDVFSKRKRSAVMAAIRSIENKDTELRFITILRSQKITGWRRGSRLPGKPDFVFPRVRLTVFIDGCFWHGCPRHGRKPKQNADYWLRKLSRNRARDRKVNRLLREREWRVLRIWEHELSNVARVTARLRAALEQ
ncbi:MAG: very short patch repair endonuclease [Opitutaceae bacterium]